MSGDDLKRPYNKICLDNFYFSLHSQLSVQVGFIKMKIRYLLLTASTMGLGSAGLAQVSAPVKTPDRSSADTINKANLDHMSDLATQTPGFSYKQGFGRTDARPPIRGISSVVGAPNAAFFIDGVFASDYIS